MKLETIISLKCYSVEGNRQWLDGGAMFGNAPKALWSGWIGSDTENRIPLACRSLVVKKDGLTILFETGIGYFMAPKLASRYGIDGQSHLLLENLQTMGINEKDVDYVVLSHLHFDHSGGLVPVHPGIENPDWQLHFPNAKYIVSKVHYERSVSPHPRDRASFIPGLAEKLNTSGRLVLINNDLADIQALNGWIKFAFTTGHTPGMMHSIIQGKKKTIFFAGDIIPGTRWIHLPIVMGYDRFPEQTVNEKKYLLEQAVNNNWLIFYTHDPHVAATKIRINVNGKYEHSEPIERLIGFDL